MRRRELANTRKRPGERSELAYVWTSVHRAPFSEVLQVFRVHAAAPRSLLNIQVALEEMASASGESTTARKAMRRNQSGYTRNRQGERSELTNLRTCKVSVVSSLRPATARKVCDGANK